MLPCFPCPSCSSRGPVRIETRHRSSIDRRELEQLIHAAGGGVVPRRAATHVVDTASSNALGGGAEEEAEHPKERVDDKWLFDAVMGPQGGEEDDEADDEEDSEEF